nr:glycine--tRNA ligase subunit beta [Gammaproteobacteria bacterium]
MTCKDFLFEIGCEELPPRLLDKLSYALANCLMKEFASAGINFKEHRVYATPRRLAVLIQEVDDHQPAREVERIGPSSKNAYDNNGMPTLACIGFARSCGVATDQLKVKQTPKGERVYYKAKETGQNTSDLLIELVNNALKNLPISKPMRWGSNKTTFIRPVHWVVLLFGNEVVSGQVFGHNTTGETRGHRFHHPQSIRITSPKDYADILFSRGHVIADFEARKNFIRKQINKTANTNGDAVISENLLREVTALVEWPVVLKGQFDPKFLDVPREALITAMQTHQKCFPIVSTEGELKAYFILVSNIESKNPDTVIRGNERVINARLSDAEFFYHNDLKHPLDSHFNKLSNVVFQKQLGTLADKTKRVIKLAKYIAKQTHADSATTERAAKLAKCDLLTEMVGEFPSLQGIMGYYYARRGEETKDCAIAIREHVADALLRAGHPEDALPIIEAFRHNSSATPVVPDYGRAIA